MTFLLLVFTFTIIPQFSCLSLVPHQQTRTQAPGVDSEAARPRTSSATTWKAHFTAKIAHSIAKGERRAQERAAQAREACTSCGRPPCLCLCDVLPERPLETQTYVLILQHPNERRKRNLSTTPLLRLVLKHVQVVVGYTFDLSSLATQCPPLEQVLQQGRQPLLLYPSATAISLDEMDAFTTTAKELSSTDTTKGNMSSCDINSSDGNVLILIDGTWTEAKRMVRDSDQLVRKCQHLQFTNTNSKSIYDALRREPDDHCLSTLEACAKALKYLELLQDEHRNLLVQKHLSAVLQAHVKSHLNNAQQMQPRSVRKASKSLYEKNKRRRQIELEWFQRQQKKEMEAPSTIPNADSSSAIRLPDGAIMRPLQVEDAPLVDSWWDYRSEKSLSLVARRIILDGGVACLGVQVDGALVASIVRYEGGALGMLYVEEAHRRKGYAGALLKYATMALQQRGDDCVAYIVDGNGASEALFASQGWERADPNIKKGTGKRRAKRQWVFRQ